VVGRPSALFRSGRSRADVHLSVDLAAVSVDDLAAEALAEINRKLGFTHGSGANDGNEGFGVGRHGLDSTPQRGLSVCLTLGTGDGGRHLKERLCLKGCPANQSAVDTVLGGIVSGVSGVHTAAVEQGDVVGRG